MARTIPSSKVAFTLCIAVATSCLFEFLWGQGIISLITCLILGALWLTRAIPHKHMKTFPEFRPYAGHLKQLWDNLDEHIYEQVFPLVKEVHPNEKIMCLSIPMQNFAVLLCPEVSSSPTPKKLSPFSLFVSLSPLLSNLALSLSLVLGIGLLAPKRPLSLSPSCYQNVCPPFFAVMYVA